MQLAKGKEYCGKRRKPVKQSLTFCYWQVKRLLTGACSRCVSATRGVPWH